MATGTNVMTSETLTIELPDEIFKDLNDIAAFHNTKIEKLVYSYIVDGIAGDSRAARRKKFTDRANEVLGKGNVPPKTVEDIFNNMVY